MTEHRQSTARRGRTSAGGRTILASSGLVDILARMAIFADEGAEILALTEDTPVKAQVILQIEEWQGGSPPHSTICDTVDGTWGDQVGTPSKVMRKATNVEGRSRRSTSARDETPSSLLMGESASAASESGATNRNHSRR